MLVTTKQFRGGGGGGGMEQQRHQEPIVFAWEMVLCWEERGLMVVYCFVLACHLCGAHTYF